MAILMRFLLVIVVGVKEVKIDRDANELTVKGTNLNLTVIREKLEKETKKKFEVLKHMAFLN